MCHAEYFRTPDNVMLPDMQSRQFTIEQIHSEVDAQKLGPGVPQEVVTEFETAKNLYLYTWFVQGFFPVANWQTCRALEKALQYRLNVANIKHKTKNKAWKLLKKAEKNGLIDSQAVATQLAQCNSVQNSQTLSKQFKQLVKNISGSQNANDTRQHKSTTSESRSPLELNLAADMQGPPTLPFDFLLLRITGILINALYQQSMEKE